MPPQEGVRFEHQCEAKSFQGYTGLQDDNARLLSQRKLVLLVDLDQTLIHTTDQLVDERFVGWEYHRLSGYPPLHTRIRPGTKEFLENISKLFEMHVVTFGTRSYAEDIVPMLDPAGKYFGSRILTRDESVDPNSKKANLEFMFPGGDELVCMIDDRGDVWEYHPTLVPVKPYVFFDGTGDINAPPGSIPESLLDIRGFDFDDDNESLFYLEGTLSEIHGRFYEAYEQSLQKTGADALCIPLPNLKDIVTGVRRQPLKGEVISFSGCFPRTQSIDQFEICSIAKFLGAELRVDLCDDLTHLVARLPDTKKVRHARKTPGIKVVSQDWLRACARTWECLPEQSYLITDSDAMIERRIEKQRAKVMKKVMKLREKAKRKRTMTAELDVLSICS